MSLPGFTAEISLDEVTLHYQSRLRVRPVSEGGILPQIIQNVTAFRVPGGLCVCWEDTDRQQSICICGQGSF